jgi:hypothetical protein
VLAHLLGRHPLGDEHRAERVVAAANHRMYLGDIQQVADAPFRRDRVSLKRQARIYHRLDITKFHGGVDAVYGDILRTESIPQVVGVFAQALGRRVGLTQIVSRPGPSPCCGHNAKQQQVR